MLGHTQTQARLYPRDAQLADIIKEARGGAW